MGAPDAWARSRVAGRATVVASPVEVPDGDQGRKELVGPLEPGDAFRYVLNVTHSGNIPAPNVTVTDSDLADLLDVFSAGAIDVDDDNEGARTCDLNDTDGLTCDLGDLAIDEVVTITIEMTVSRDLVEDDCGPNSPYENTAYVFLDGEYADEDSATITLECSVDVEIEKSVEVPDGEGGWEAYSGPLGPGDSFRYVLTVTQTGNLPALNVTVEDDLSALLNVFEFDEGVDDITFDLPLMGRQCELDTDDVLTCSLLNIAVGGTVTVTIPMVVAEDLSEDDCGDTRYTNTAEVYLDGEYADEDSATITLECDSSVTIDKTAVEWAGEGDPGDALEGPLGPGDYFAYVLTIESTGDVTAPDVNVSDPLTAITSIASVVGDPTTDVGTCTYSVAGLDCDLGDLAPDTTVTIVIPMRVNNDLLESECGPNNRYVNTATVTWGDDETKQDSATITLECATGVDFDKRLAARAPSSIPLLGGATVYELEVSNDGSARATDIWVRDTIPAVLEIDLDAFEDANEGLPCTVDGNEVICGPLTIEAGSSVTIEIPVRVAASASPTACGVVTNDGQVFINPDVDVEEPDFSELEADLGDSANVTIVCPPPPPPPTLTPSIGIVKSASPTSIVLPPGEDATAVVTYTYLVTNTGNTTLTNVELDDDILGDLTTQLRAALGSSTMAIGQSVTVTVTQTVGTADVGTLTNIAVVSGDGGGRTVTATDDATVEITQVAGIVEEPAISIVKDALITPDSNGDKVVVVDNDTETAQITYRYTITNTGDTTLANITLVDDVIGDLTDLLDTTTLEPGESTTVEVTYTTTAAQLDAGSVTNIGTTTGTSPSGTTVTADDDETVEIIQVLDAVTPRPLPRTGTNAMTLTLMGLLLAALGASTLLLSARRRRGEPL